MRLPSVLAGVACVWAAYALARTLHAQGIAPALAAAVWMACSPYQIYYAQGGLYVFAVVPAYGEARQFAIERIKTLHATDQRFVPDATVDAARHADSLGVNLGGIAEAVAIEFQDEAAP